MTVNTQKDGTKLTITADGKLGTTSAPQLEKALKENIGGVTELVFDFAELEYMASAGLRVLLSAAKVMKKNTKQIDNLLYRAKKELRTILRKSEEYLS